MVLIHNHPFLALLEHVTAVAPELLTACRWLTCGPRVAPLILGKDTRPTNAEMSRLIGVFHTAPPAAFDAGHLLLTAYSRFFAEVEVALGCLIAADENAWSHPTQILGRPCADFAQLLATCRQRLETATGTERQRLKTIATKLERAVRIEARARQRRSGIRSLPLKKGRPARGSGPPL